MAWEAKAGSKESMGPLRPSRTLKLGLLSMIGSHWKEGFMSPQDQEQTAR